MATYRLFPSTSGPATATAYSGPYLAGRVFQVTAGSMWLTGVWWWCCGTGQATTAVKVALWQPGPAASGVLITPVAATSGPLTPGAWNFVPIAAPVQLAIGTPYIAVVGTNDSFPFTTDQFGTGEPFEHGIASGPLFAYGQSTASHAPYSIPQSSFDVSTSDPTAVMPLQPQNFFNSWVDVQVTDTAPAGFSGTWRLWPNKYDASPDTIADTNIPFTLATEIRSSKPLLSSRVWWYSLAGSSGLPTWCGVYPASGATLGGPPVLQATSPTWLLPGGGAGSAGAGWVYCTLPGKVKAGNYKVACHNANGAAGSWSSTEYGYFRTGAGASGITSGPLFSPPMAAAGQAWVWFNAPGATPPWTDGSSQEPANGTFAMDHEYPGWEVDYLWPGTSDPPGAIAESFWVDWEVTPLAAHTGYSLPVMQLAA
jgi:hypothetical protein